MQFKEKVAQFLTSYTSPILLDPEYWLPAARRRSKNAEILLAYEQVGTTSLFPGGYRDFWMISPRRV